MTQTVAVEEKLRYAGGNYSNAQMLSVSAAKKKSQFKKIKISCGIACCRFAANGEPEILLICKRFTYAYCIFIHSNYNTKSQEALSTLLNEMTLDEKMDILSLNFDQMWFRVWYINEKTITYAQMKNQFELIHLIDDAGVGLRRAISVSNNKDRIWEIPKGHKASNNESELVCAMREFYEETGVAKTGYQLLSEQCVHYDYIENKILYKNKYFVAIANRKLNLNRVLSVDQLKEISDIRWLNMAKIKLVDSSGRLETLVRSIFKKFKKQVVGF